MSSSGLHQPVGDLYPARAATTPSALDDFGAGENLRPVDVDVAPREGDVFTDAPAVLL